MKNLPAVLTHAQCISACFSFNHSYGMMDEEEKQRLQFDCHEWWHAIRKELVAEGPNQHPVVVAEIKQKYPCMQDVNCWDRTQCWEPCGDLGNSSEHAHSVKENK